MKLYVTILLNIMFCFSNLLYAQTAIGKTQTTNSNISLEFGSGNKGLILPYVINATAMNNVVPGTLVMDVYTKRLRLLRNPNEWFDLSLDVTNFNFNGINIPSTIGQVDNSKQLNLSERSDSSLIIGINSGATTSGALILADPDKAMILPKMDSPHLKIIDPAPGMMAYDTLTHQLAVFNGTVWTFWN